MAQESTFAKIKRAVEEEKNKKVRGEAKLSSLKDEQTRIFNQINEEAGKSVSSVEEAEAICGDLEETIKKDIESMVDVLKEEGIEV